MTEDLNGKEAELRIHPEYSEVPDEDKEALTEFRKTGDLAEFVEEDGDTYAASHGGTAILKPRTSMGSSVSSIRSKMSAQASLESIHEEDPSVENGGEDADHETDNSHFTPSPTTNRRRTISSAHTDASISTLGLTRDGTNESDEDDEYHNRLMTQTE